MLEAYDFDADVKLKKSYTRLARFRQCLATVLVCLLGFSNGSSSGWLSPTGPLLMSDQSPLLEKLDFHDVTMLGSVTFIGSAVCCLFWGTLVDQLGRKKAAIFLAIPLIISWGMTTLANSAFWLLIARFLQGVGGAGACINAPVFITEIAQDDLRGFFGAFYTASSCLGVLFSYIVGAYFGYYVLAGSCLAVPCIFLVTFIWMPETPMYLWSQGKTKKAKKSLLWYRGGDLVATEETLAKYELLPKTTEKPTMKDLVATAGAKKALKIGIALMVATQASCFSVILNFAVDIFEICGTPLSPYNASIFLGTIQVMATVPSIMMVDRLGRRYLVVSSQLIMAISFAVLGTYLLLFSKLATDSVFRWVPILALSTYIVAFSGGTGSVVFVIASEIFPPKIRGLAMGKLMIVLSVLGFVVIGLFPYMLGFLQWFGFFYFYGSLCLLFGIYFYMYLPETKNISQDEIINLLNGNSEAVRVKKGEVQPLLTDKK